jgi:hypothetical protein
MTLVKRDLMLPEADGHNSGKMAFTLDGVFSKQECKEWIEMTNKRGLSHFIHITLWIFNEHGVFSLGYEEALVNTGPSLELQILRTDIK